jgi:hypothetical protein
MRSGLQFFKKAGAVGIFPDLQVRSGQRSGQVLIAGQNVRKVLEYPACGPRTSGIQQKTPEIKPVSRRRILSLRRFFQGSQRSCIVPHTFRSLSAQEPGLGRNIRLFRKIPCRCRKRRRRIATLERALQFPDHPLAVGHVKSRNRISNKKKGQVVRPGLSRSERRTFRKPWQKVP